MLRTELKRWIVRKTRVGSASTLAQEMPSLSRSSVQIYLHRHMRMGEDRAQDGIPWTPIVGFQVLHDTHCAPGVQCFAAAAAETDAPVLRNEEGAKGSVFVRGPAGILLVRVGVVLILFQSLLRPLTSYSSC